MQQLVRLRRRPPFPDGFFTSARTSSSGSSSGTSGLHRFSDSSRSRPPSRSNGGGRGNSSNTRNSSNGRGKQAQQSLSTDTEAIPNGSAALRSQRQQGQPFMSRFTNEHPLQEVPRTIQPVSILRANPIDVCLDNFYSLNRPLLEVTTKRGERRSASAKDWKPLSIVGESKEEALPRADLDLMGNELVGEYDHYLVTEPEGADPEWGEGADRHLAALEHNVLPPAPSTSQAVTPEATTTEVVVGHAKDQLQQDIDFLFPWQAEARKEEEEAKQLGESVWPPVAAQRPSLEQQFMERASQANKRTLDSSAAQRFLGSQLVKTKWSGLWDWESMRKALAAAQHKASKGKEKASLEDTEGVRKPLEALRQTSRSTLRMRARAKRSAREERQQIVGLEQVFERSRQRMEQSGRRGGSIMVVFQADGQGKKEGGSRLTTTQQGGFEGEMAEVMQRVGEVTKFFDKNVAFEGKPTSTTPFSSPTGEVQGDFISIDIEGGFTDLSNGQEGTSGTRTVPERDSAGNAIPEDARAVVQHIVDAWNSGTKAALEGKDDAMPAMPAMPSSLRDLVIGSRFGLIQCGRGRSLRPRLADRLAIRGVELVGQGTEKTVKVVGGVSMDSVKRKRKKRISRHKYKKRRKATRAERRRTGK